MDYQNIFGYTAICLSSLFYCSLVIPFLNVLRCKISYELVSMALINIIYVDCFAWYIYADKISCEQLKLGNTIGACVSMSLITIYLILELKKYLVDSILNALIFILGTLVMHKCLTIVIEDPQMVGKVCICTKLLTFFVPIIMIYRIVKEKNYKLISINSTITYMCSCIGWTLFGKAVNDFIIMCPNSIGIFFCIIQIIVYVCFKKKYSVYSGKSSTIDIERSSLEEAKKDESTTISIDEEKQYKGGERPVKIVSS